MSNDFSVIKHHDPEHLQGGRVCLAHSSRSQSTPEQSEWEAKQKLEAEIMEECCMLNDLLLIAISLLLAYAKLAFFNIAQDHLLRDDATHSGLGPPMSTENQESLTDMLIGQPDKDNGLTESFSFSNDF